MTSGTPLLTVYLLATAAAIAAAGCLLLPARLLTGMALLVLPLIGLVELAALGVATRGVGQAYSPLIVIALIYLGLVCPPRASWLLLIPAAATWLLLNDADELGVHAAMLIRLPITMTVWVLVGELLARRTTQLHARTALLAGKVTTDPLTGLSNRRALPDLLAAARPGDALLMLDLDRFRHINESRGHGGGDRALADFGAAVRTSLRGQDRAVRYGGDEILLLLPGSGAPPNAVTRMETVLNRLAATWNTLQPDITFSAGGVVLTLGQPPEIANQTADQRLYNAKQAGRNSWQLTD